MRAVVVDKPGRTVIREAPEPRPSGPYDARVKTICGSLCNSTDLKITHGQLPFVTFYPTILGHEVVGRIIEVGPKVRTFRVGDLVSRPHASPPQESGLHEAFGGFCEYGIVTDVPAMRADGIISPQERFDQLPAPSDADPMALTQMITLRETLSFLNALGVRAKHSLLIFGAGPVGIAFSLVAQQLGLHPIIVVARRQSSLHRALKFGRASHIIDNSRDCVPDVVKRLTGGEGVDWVIEAIGANEIIKDALDSLKPAGFIGPYGIPSREESESVVRQSSRVKQVSFSEESSHATISEWVSRGLIPAREFVTHELPWEKVNQGIALLESKEAFKVLLWITRE